MSGATSGHCWYVAYGSNMDPAALRRYLPPELEAAASREVELANAVYFAGRSKTWGAAVAFLTLREQPDVRTHARAFQLPEVALWHIARGENGIEVQSQLFDQAIKSLQVHDHAELGFELDSDGYRGKYNALLRLQDIDGLPAYTITTSHRLKRGEAASEYLQLIERAKRSAV